MKDLTKRGPERRRSLPHCNNNSMHCRHKSDSCRDQPREEALLQDATSAAANKKGEPRTATFTIRLRAARNSKWALKLLEIPCQVSIPRPLATGPKPKPSSSRMHSMQLVVPKLESKTVLSAMLQA